MCIRDSLLPVGSGVPQGSVLGPLLYLLFTSDLPSASETTVATYADDTAILATHSDPSIASLILQESLNSVQLWLDNWRIKINSSKSVHVTFTTRKANCPPVTINGQPVPQAESAKYLGMHLDRRLTWKKHITSKKFELNHKVRNIYWLIGLSLIHILTVVKSI